MISDEHVSRIAVYAKSSTDVWLERYHGPFAWGELIRFSGSDALKDMWRWILNYFANGIRIIQHKKVVAESTQSGVFEECEKRAQLTIHYFKSGKLELVPTLGLANGGGIGFREHKFKTRVDRTIESLVNCTLKAILMFPREFSS